MAWQVVGDNRLSRARTRAYAAPEGSGHWLGVAVFTIQSAEPRSRQPLQLRELDRSTRERSGDDPIANLVFRPRGERDLELVSATLPADTRTTDEDMRLRVEFRLADEELSDDAAPPDHRCRELRLPYGAVEGETDLTFAVCRAEGAYRREVPVVFNHVFSWLTPDPGNEWDKGDNLPTASQTVDGYPIERDGDTAYVRVATNRRIKLQRGSGSGRDSDGRPGYGIYYPGRHTHGNRRRAQEFLMEERYTGDENAWRRLLVKAYDCLGEGASSAINTNDDCTVTLGAGWSGRSPGLNLLLRKIGETEQIARRFRTAFEDLPGFTRQSGTEILQFDLSRGSPPSCWSESSWQTRTAVGAYVDLIKIAEDAGFGRYVVAADIAAFVEFEDGLYCRRHKPPLQRDPACPGCRGMATQDEIDDANAIALEYFAALEEPELRDDAHKKALAARALAGMASYNHHGRPGIATPIKDFVYAYRHADDPSDMIALLIKIHAEDCWASATPPRDGPRPQDKDIFRNAGWKLLDRSLNNKFKHFQEGCRADIGRRHWGGLEPERIRRYLPRYQGPPTNNPRNRWKGVEFWGHTEGAEEDPEARERIFVQIYTPTEHAGRYDFGEHVRYDHQPSTSGERPRRRSGT